MYIHVHCPIVSFMDTCTYHIQAKIRLVCEFFNGVYLQALNYAKNVPKPKQMSSRKRGSPGSAQYRDSQADDNQEEITVLEILRLRHEKEKKEVDTIRKDLASKIRL